MHNFFTKKTITIYLAVIAIISVSSFFIFKDKSVEALKTFEKGNQLFKSHQYQEAIKAYDEAIKINPQDADAYHNKGVALGNLGKYQEAIEAYDEAIKINPQYAIAYGNKGNVLDNLDKYQEAIEAYNEAIKINPQYALAYHNKGVTLEKLGKHQEAIEAYNEAIKINPQNADAYHNKGVVLGNLGKYQEAIEVFDKAIKINPQDALAYHNKGVALEKFGKHQEAIEAYDEAIKINPQYANAYHNKGVALEKFGKHQEAIEAYEESKKIKYAIAEEVDNNKNHLNPTPLGIKLNIDTLKDVTKKYKVVSTTPHILKGYNSNELNFKEIDIETISSAGFITNENQVVVLLGMVMHEKKFNELYDTLKSKYNLIKSQLPNIGDKHAEFEAGNCLVVIDSPHLGFQTSVTYLTKEFRKKRREAIEEENQAKIKKNNNAF